MLMSHYDDYSDEELIVHDFDSGESGISDYLMEKYKELVRYKARAMFLIGGETDDLIQEGMIGLFKAVQNYQPDQRYIFSNLCRTLCIDRQLYSAIQNSNRQKHMPLEFVCITKSGRRAVRDIEAVNWIGKSGEQLLSTRKVPGHWSRRLQKVTESYGKQSAWIII